MGPLAHSRKKSMSTGNSKRSTWWGLGGGKEGEAKNKRINWVRQNHQQIDRIVARTRKKWPTPFASAFCCAVWEPTPVLCSAWMCSQAKRTNSSIRMRISQETPKGESRKEEGKPHEEKPHDKLSSQPMCRLQMPLHLGCSLEFLIYSPLFQGEGNPQGG